MENVFIEPLESNSLHLSPIKLSSISVDTKLTPVMTVVVGWCTRK